MALRFRRLRWLLAALLLGLLPGAIGCLSLGGKTVVEENGDTKNRLTALEGRVSALEQATVRGGPPPLVSAPIPEPIYGPRH